MGITISIPRLAINRTNRFSISTESPEVYFRISIFISFLDHFCEQLNDRFLNQKALLKQFFFLLNANEKNETEFIELQKTYSSDIEVDEISAIGEFAIWHQQIKNKNPKNATKALIGCYEEIFPTVHRLLLILITLTVTRVSGERSFPSLRRLENLFKKHSWWKSLEWFSGYEHLSRCCRNHRRNIKYTKFKNSSH